MSDDYFDDAEVSDTDDSFDDAEVSDANDSFDDAEVSNSDDSFDIDDSSDSFYDTEDSIDEIPEDSKFSDASENSCIASTEEDDIPEDTETDEASDLDNYELESLEDEEISEDISEVDRYEQLSDKVHELANSEYLSDEEKISQLTDIGDELGVDFNEDDDADSDLPVFYDEYTGEDSSWLDENYDTQSILDAENLSDESRRALYDYTLDGYGDVNKYLSDSDFEHLSPAHRDVLDHKVDVITDAVDEHELPCDTKLHRGANLREMFHEDLDSLSTEELNEKYAGLIYEKPSFTSTSTSVDTANKFASGSQCGVLDINAPKGTSALCLGELSEYSGDKGTEQEVLLQRGTQFQINSIFEADDKIHVDQTVVGRRR